MRYHLDERRRKAVRILKEKKIEETNIKKHLFDKLLSFEIETSSEICRVLLE